MSILKNGKGNFYKKNLTINIFIIRSKKFILIKFCNYNQKYFFVTSMYLLVMLFLL